VSRRGGQRVLLITGATGTLGRHVVDALDARPGVGVRVLSRHERSAGRSAGRQRVTADLALDPLDDALHGIDAVIHLASTKGSGEVDVIATERLLAAAAAADVRHVVVISIIGCDRIPLPFYRSKVRIEELTRASAVPWSIVRVAQFHSFVERLVATPAGLPVPAPIVADLRFQPVDEREVAERLVEIALGDPLGYAPEIAGPEVLTLADIAATWLAETNRAATLVPIPLDAIQPGEGSALPTEPWVTGTLEGYRVAANTPRGERTLGHVSFADWLRERRGSDALGRR